MPFLLQWIMWKSHKTTVPSHLQDSHYKGSANLGHGIGYQYAHNLPKSLCKTTVFTEMKIKGAVFYEPSDMGYEQKIQEHMKKIKEEA